MKELVKNLRKTEIILGETSKKVTKSENKNRKLVRKSIYAIKNIFKGDVFTINNILLKD